METIIFLNMKYTIYIQYIIKRKTIFCVTDFGVVWIICNFLYYRCAKSMFFLIFTAKIKKIKSFEIPYNTNIVYVGIYLVYTDPLMFKVLLMQQRMYEREMLAPPNFNFKM